MSYRYAFNKYNKELMAMAVGISLGISTKQSVEICTALRKKPLVRAKVILEDSISQKKAIPFRRYNRNIGHRPKMGPGRFPNKAANAILDIVKAAEANAQFKGLNTSNMILTHICAHRASQPWHYGRQRGVKMKRTHIEVVLEETKVKDKTTSKKDSAAEKSKDKPGLKKESLKKEAKTDITASARPTKTNVPKSVDKKEPKNNNHNQTENKENNKENKPEGKKEDNNNPVKK